MATAADGRIKNIMQGLPASGGSGQWPADSNANSGQKLVPAIPKGTGPASFGKRVGAAVLKRKPGKASGPAYG